MKQTRISQSRVPGSRRGFVTGTLTIGAAAAAVTALPQLKPQGDESPQALPKPERGGGYTLSEHVKRYYKTTLV